MTGRTIYFYYLLFTFTIYYLLCPSGVKGKNLRFDVSRLSENAFAKLNFYRIYISFYQFQYSLHHFDINNKLVRTRSNCPAVLEESILLDHTFYVSV